MKKLFLVFLLFLAINSFAIDFSAQLFGAFNFLDYYEEELGMGGGARGRIRLEGSTEIGKFGGWLRFDLSSLQGSPVGIYGYVFYKPFDTLSFYVTRNNDGHFGLNGNALWNFYGLPGDVIGITHDSSNTGMFNFNFDDEDIYGIPGFNNVFFQGFTEGTFITYQPAEDLTINLGFPVFSNLGVWNMLKSMTLQVTYKLKDVGLLGLTYSGGSMLGYRWDDSAVLRAYWNTTVSGFDLDIGIGYMFPEKNGNNARNYPVNIGAAAAFDAGKVNIKTRLLISGFGNYLYNGNTYNSPFDIIFDFLPSMPLSGNITGYLNFNFFIHIPDDDDSLFGFSLFPYITINPADSFAFYTGLELVYQDEFYFRIPFGLSVKF